MSVMEKKASEQILVMLSRVLSNTYLLLVKTQNFHWNLVDPRFHSLHGFFEEQYEDLFSAADEIAERIRSIGQRAPGSMREFLDLSNLDESTGSLTGDEMLSELLGDHEHLVKELRQQIKESQACEDEGTADLLIQRLKVHEKSAWMIRSHIG